MGEHLLLYWSPPCTQHTCYTSYCAALYSHFLFLVLNLEFPCFDFYSSVRFSPCMHLYGFLLTDLISVKSVFASKIPNFLWVHWTFIQSNLNGAHLEENLEVQTRSKMKAGESFKLNLKLWKTHSPIVLFVFIGLFLFLFLFNNMKSSCQFY